MQINTEDLMGPLLDWAVAVAIGTLTAEHAGDQTFYRLKTVGVESGTWVGPVHPAGQAACGQSIWRPSSDWRQGGPLLSEYAISVRPITDAQWLAEEFITHNTARAVDDSKHDGYLVAGMRVLVKSLMGDTITVPAHLRQQASMALQ
ncbi:phage protein NinX family protein [Vreelandella rituensis]|uniref:DUF2591 domain-containing protein n=1 Tax=Vreelandella rituensis TaxID=2282306 RepID=A0A368U911_9GAMM|nr:phage protein NinX family protein [Halomonas rituensis]RCV93689.1 DUF2591 domain-containing protein [Halomonas rituensis]